MVNPEYWQNLEKLGNDKLYPNEEEVKLFLSQMQGSTLLLGETKQLIPYVDEAVDICPCGEYPKSFKGNWMNLEGHWGTIIGDGVLNLCDIGLVEAVKPHCNIFVARVFERWIYERWIYATHFPTEFIDVSETINTRPGCNIVIWRF